MCFVNYVVLPWMLGTIMDGTVHPASPFNVAKDAIALRGAMKGWGTDEQAIIDILTHRSNEQRQDIFKFYTKKYRINLIDDLKSELGGKFEDLIIALMMPPDDYLAKQLHKAMTGLGTEKHTLVEILCSQSKPDLQLIVDAYERLYDRPLVEDLGTETSGYLRSLLILIVTHAGNPTPLSSAKVAVKLATTLHEAGKLKSGTDGEVFNKILAHESVPQLRLIFEENKSVSGRTIEQPLKNEMSGYVLEAVLAIVECTQCPPAFFAKRLHDSMAGVGTDDRTLIRIIVSRSEIDLAAIKREYERLYDTTLKSDVWDDTSGDYRKALLALIGP